MSYGIEKSVWEEIKAQIKIENLYNKALVKEVGISKKDFECLIDGCTVTGKIEIVSYCRGRDNDQKYKTIKRVFVDQRSYGMEGDSFVGEIYAEFKENKWLKVPYEC